MCNVKEFWRILFYKVLDKKSEKSLYVSIFVYFPFNLTNFLTEKNIRILFLRKVCKTFKQKRQKNPSNFVYILAKQWRSHFNLRIFLTEKKWIYEHSNFEKICKKGKISKLRERQKCPSNFVYIHSKQCRSPFNLTKILTAKF